MPKKTTAKYAQPKSLETQFQEVASIIHKARAEAYVAVNAVLVDTYYQVGGYISARIDAAEWGKAVVNGLADYLRGVLPTPKGFSASNLWRMRQFFDLYNGYEKLATLLREIPWSGHLHIISRTRTHEERVFYLQEAGSQRLSVRQIERLLNTGAYERSLSMPKLSAPLKELHPESQTIFRDSYILDFIQLPRDYSEADLRKGIVRNLKSFILEFGRDFAFIGEEHRVQVGMKDFFIDLLFYHRELCCLVAFELKIQEFEPEHLGKMNFYLEALDRDVRKEHENPSIGVVLCKGKDAEVVEYALARTTSPAAIAEYRTKLPDKQLLREKLHEFFDFSVREMGAPYEMHID